MFQSEPSFLLFCFLVFHRLIVFTSSILNIILCVFAFILSHVSLDSVYIFDHFELILSGVHPRFRSFNPEFHETILGSLSLTIYNGKKYPQCIHFCNRVLYSFKSGLQPHEVEIPVPVPLSIVEPGLCLDRCSLGEDQMMQAWFYSWCNA